MDSNEAMQVLIEEFEANDEGGIINCVSYSELSDAIISDPALKERDSDNDDELYIYLLEMQVTINGLKNN